MSDRVEAELLSSFSKLIQGQRSRLKAMLDEATYSDCFPLAELLKVVNNVWLEDDKKVCLILPHRLLLSL